MKQRQPSKNFRETEVGLEDIENLKNQMLVLFNKVAQNYGPKNPVRPDVMPEKLIENQGAILAIHSFSNKTDMIVKPAYMRQLIEKLDYYGIVFSSTAGSIFDVVNVHLRDKDVKETVYIDLRQSGLREKISDAIKQEERKHSDYLISQGKAQMLNIANSHFQGITPAELKEFLGELAQEVGFQATINVNGARSDRKIGK